MAKTFFSFCLFLLITLTMAGLHVSDPVPPAVFIFGDSTLDIGTNNFIPENTARVDMPPYGVDYRGPAPTGRFSNGYNTADFIAQFMNLKESPPAFLHIIFNNMHYLKSIKNFRGLNFASGGAGILDDTGKKEYTKVVPMGEQVQQFATVRSNLSFVLGADADTKIHKSFFLFSVGSNDIFDSFAHDYAQGCNQDFMTSLMGNYSTHLRNLLDLGAAKLAIISVPSLGCCPYQRTWNKSGGCMEALNDCAQVFYTKLDSLLQNLSSEYPAMNYSLANAFDLTNAVINGSLPTQATELQQACCGKGRFNATTRCEPSANLCTNREDFLFWDQFHPTASAAYAASSFLLTGFPPYLTPMNFSALYMLEN